MYVCVTERRACVLRVNNYLFNYGDLVKRSIGKVDGNWKPKKKRLAKWIHLSCKSWPREDPHSYLRHQPMCRFTKQTRTWHDLMQTSSTCTHQLASLPVQATHSLNDMKLLHQPFSCQFTCMWLIHMHTYCLCTPFWKVKSLQSLTFELME